MIRVDIYTRDAGDTSAARALCDARAQAELGLKLRIIDLANAATQVISASVLKVVLDADGRGLPLVIVDGETWFQGRVPSAQELEIRARRARDAAGFTEVDGYEEDSAVDFPTRSRVHMNLIVKDVAESVKFYSIFFGQPPTKVREFYAKFELEDPPIHLALMEDPHGGAKPHFGIQVKSSKVIRKSINRFGNAGFYLYDENETECCFAKQTKTWVADPDGQQWEVFVTNSDESSEGCASDCICYQDMTPNVVTS